MTSIPTPPLVDDAPVRSGRGTFSSAAEIRARARELVRQIETLQLELRDLQAEAAYAEGFEALMASRSRTEVRP